MALLETRELTKQYPTVTALDHLSVTLEPGIIGVVGANGAGKSTLLKILLGLVPPTSGEVTLLGYDAFGQGAELRQFVGYMPEHDCLPLDVTATEFVSHMAQINGLPGAAARERTAETLRHVGLFEERYRVMKGYSTGMKQRVKLAQALVHDPRVMLLDEPTNGLDPAGRDEMLDLVSRTGNEFGIAVMMSSHLLSEIERVCDYLVVIDGGRLMRAGPLGSFTERTQVLAIEVDGDRRDEFVLRMRGQGWQVVEEDHAVLVWLGESRPYDYIRDTVVDLGLALVRIEQRRQSLEDLFRPGGHEQPEGERDVAAV
jgi:ABC-2 type transport system ATP-binding protein